MLLSQTCDISNRGLVSIVDVVLEVLFDLFGRELDSVVDDGPNFFVIVVGLLKSEVEVGSFVVVRLFVPLFVEQVYFDHGSVLVELPAPPLSVRLEHRIPLIK